MSDAVDQLAQQVTSIRKMANEMRVRGKLSYEAANAAVAVLTSWRGLCEIRSKKQAERVAPRLVQILQERITEALAALARSEA